MQAHRFKALRHRKLADDRAQRRSWRMRKSAPGCSVGLSFRDLGEATEVAYTQGPFKTEERCALHREGWTDGFDKLERLVSAQA